MKLLNPTPSTPLTVGAGALANIVDTDTATTCELQGTASTYFWWILDLGASKAINKIELLQFWERSAGNTNFQLVCSDSPLTSSNTGTVFGSTFSSTTTPTDITRNDSNTARYWGLYRNGDFSADGRVVVSCFNIYDAKGIINLKPSTPLTTTSGALSNILDVDTSTKHEVHGLTVGTTYFWWILDLGVARRITQVVLKQFYELVVGNANFQIVYSSSLLSPSNNGTQLGSNFSSTTTATDITQTGNATARYWGLLRVGDFSADGPVGISDFLLYEGDDYSRSISETVSATSASASRVVAAQRAIAETVNGSDAAARVFAAKRAIAETLGAATDSIARIAAYNRALSEAAAGSDAVARVTAAYRAISESAPASDTVLRVVAAHRGITETLAAATDLATRVCSYPRLISETVSGVDAVTYVLVMYVFSSFWHFIFSTALNIELSPTVSIFESSFDTDLMLDKFQETSILQQIELVG